MNYNMMYTSMEIDFLDLSTKTYNGLKRGGINTIGELLSCTDEELLNIRNFGKGCLEEIKNIFSPELIYSNDSRVERNNVIDIDLNPNPNYEKFYRSYNRIDQRIHLFSSENLKKDLEKLSERDRQVIEKIYGIGNETNVEDIPTVANELEMTRDFVKKISMKNLENLNKVNSFDLFKLKNSDLLNDEDRDLISKIEKRIGNDNSKPVNLNDEDIQNDFQKLKNMAIKVRDIQTSERENSITELSLSTRTYNALIWGGIKTIDQLTSLSDEKILKIRGLGQGGFIEIKEKLKEYCNNSDEEKKLENEPVPKLELSQISVDAKGQKSELEILKLKKESLIKYIEELKEKTKKAEELLASYEKAENSSNIEKSKDE